MASKMTQISKSLSRFDLLDLIQALMASQNRFEVATITLRILDGVMRWGRDMVVSNLVFLPSVRKDSVLSGRYSRVVLFKPQRVDVQ
jgi:hypothetical protein